MKTREPILTCNGHRVYPEPVYRFSGSEITSNPDVKDGELESELHQDWDGGTTQSEEDEEEQRERELDGE